MTRYGVMDHGGAARSAPLSVWSGPFMSTREADGRAVIGARQITLTVYSGDKVIVRLPDGATFPRTPENFEAIDAAISKALNEYEKARGSVQLEVAP